ncbi:MarR family winged helix-turn-helix transcriptional regulator [Streptomyces sp. NBC_00234]|uniref:MarR family winged helix-turn-helix transcriptional regulator n=1 Tax=Streptomyces sp. NBC_00234 TaxID=2903638 RepID=UPI002E29D41B|nr:MarR family winged helix-turn-helix transcriptional regulator [Streptomyces sp. NBC_00234]
MASTRNTQAADSGDQAPGHELQAFAVKLRQMNGEINRIAHAFTNDQGLHATDVQALAAILDSETPLTPGLLRTHLGLTSGAVTACLDRLEKAGHIRRVRESKDRRVVHLHYLPDARSAARAHFMPLAKATARAQESFSPDELATVLRFLDALNDELGQVHEGR